MLIFTTLSPQEEISNTLSVQSTSCHHSIVLTYFYILESLQYFMTQYPVPYSKKIHVYSAFSLTYEAPNNVAQEWTVKYR